MIKSLDTQGECDIETLQDEWCYVKLKDQNEPEQTEQSYNSWRIGGMLAAFLSLISYTGSNYVAGTQTGDIFAGKIANSLSLGVFGIVYIILMIRRKDHRFIRAFESVTNIFGNSHQSIPDQDVIEIRKALVVSLLWGFMNAIGMTSLYIALNDASSHNFNISIWVAILSGNWLYALWASFFVFKEKISIFQTLGVFINLGGVLIISLCQFGGGVTLTMVTGSAIASSWLGVRIILSRYCTDRLESLVFIMANFIAELIFGIAWILVSWVGLFEFHIEFSAQMIVFFGGIFAACAEIFLFIGVERGIAGAVVSIAGTNTILVGLLNWIFQGATPSFVQVLAIGLTTAGIIVMSIGDMMLNYIRRQFAASLK